jgi:replicative DNA helicase
MDEETTASVEEETKVQRISEVAKKVVEDAKQHVTSGRALPGLSTGFKSIDNMTGGFIDGELTLLAARPSMGKTALGVNMLSNTKKPVLFFSMEMPASQIARRVLAAESNVPINSIMYGSFVDDRYEWSQLVVGLRKLEQSDFFIDDTVGLSVKDAEEIINVVREKLREKEKDLALVLFDYLQIMTTGKAFSRNDEITKISQGLKKLAKKQKLPILCLSQLSRTLESRQDKRPMLSDLRDSGSLEQDADVVMMLYRESFYKPDDADIRKKANLILSKNRNGVTGETEIGCDLTKSRFYDIIEVKEEEPLEDLTL